jgi:Skp family chaperone for outer membrane proteins
MKKTLLTLLCAAALVSSASAQTTPSAPVILVVDVGAVFNSFSDAQAAQLKFQSAVEEANKQITDMLSDGQAMAKKAQDLQANVNNTALTQDARDQYKKQYDDLQTDMQQKEVEIAQFKQTTEQTLSTRRSAIVQAEFDKIRLAVVEVAHQRGATLVLNSSGLGVVYSDPSMDITKQVLENLNAGAASVNTSALGNTTLQ